MKIRPAVTDYLTRGETERQGYTNRRSTATFRSEYTKRLQFLMIYALTARFMPTEEWNRSYKLLDCSKKVHTNVNVKKNKKCIIMSRHQDVGKIVIQEYAMKNSIPWHEFGKYLETTERIKV
jgi:hypothetical protein